MELKKHTLYYTHHTSLVYGNTIIGEGSSLWPYSVIRAEHHHVKIGCYTNIQDFVMIHIGMKSATEIGDYCSIAHRSVIHSAKIGNNCLIGIGAIIMDGCKIGDNCIINSGVCLRERTKIPDNTIVDGPNGEIIRNRNNYVMNKLNAHMYYENAKAYSKKDYQIWSSDYITTLKYKLITELKNEMVEQSHKYIDL